MNVFLCARKSVCVLNWFLLAKDADYCMLVHEWVWLSYASTDWCKNMPICFIIRAQFPL